MSEERLDRLETLFHRLVELAPGERVGVLDAECGEDTELRARLVELLAADDPHETMRTWRRAIHAKPDAVPDDDLPGPIGPYRPLCRAGTGGMGVVYEAEQREPVERTVALKLIRRGIDTEPVVARFELERRALARMDHPNVARIFDAGETPDGRPYFAMEFVRGVPITDFSDQRNLSIRQRLELFQQVCAGVQHAHRRGILRRDLKPSNVLVVDGEGAATPKIIDFGIAKAIAGDEEGATRFTQVGQPLGTPAYMSPEQASGGAIDIDTRSDVYSLGILLYEMLAGSLPLERGSTGDSLDAFLRRIREDDPPRPSTRVTTAGAVAVEIAGARRTSPGGLEAELRGDLDWIVMRALEKDRERRYGSVSELSADITRHLRHEPVMAGPPGLGYRLRKFTRRHRVAVAAAAVVLLSLIAGAVGTAYGLLEARREARAAQQVADFLTDLFESSRPRATRGEDVTARDLLDRGARQLRTDLAGQPVLQARLESIVGDIYVDLGLRDEGGPLLERSVPRLRELLGENHPQTLRGRAARALWLRYDDRFDEAEAIYIDVVERSRARRGAAHPDTLRFMAGLAALRKDAGRVQEAEAQIREVIRIQERELGGEHPDTLRSKGELARVLQLLDRTEEAGALTLQVLAARRRVLGEDHPETVYALGNLGYLRQHEGRLDEAESLLQEALASLERIFGADHPETLTGANNLAILYWSQGKFDEGADLFLDTLERQRRVLGPDHHATLRTANNLGLIRLNTGRPGEAEELFRLSAEGQARALGDDHYETWAARKNVALALWLQGRVDEAAPAYEAALEAFRRLLGPGHRETIRTVSTFAYLEILRGQREAADRRYAEAIALFREHLDDSADSEIRATLYARAANAAQQGEVDRALELLGEAVDLGYADPAMLQDPELAPLHARPAWDALAARVRDAAAADS